MNGPFAIKTELKLSLVGPAAKADVPEDDYCITCHRILTNETIVEGNKKSKVAFSVKTAKVKEVYNLNAVFRVLENDFVNSKQEF